MQTFQLYQVAVLSAAVCIVYRMRKPFSFDEIASVTAECLGNSDAKSPKAALIWIALLSTIKET